MFNCLTITSSLVVFMVSFSLSRFLSQVTKKVPFLKKYFNFKKISQAEFNLSEISVGQYEQLYYS
jgi:hypothetical protein